MKVYIVSQEWSSPYDGNESNILGVYDSEEKAKAKIKELYDEDIDWVKEHMEEDDEFDENEFDGTYSSIMFAEWWSTNYISDFEVE